MALFVAIEFDPRGRDDPRTSFAGPRPWRVMAFFLVLGASNMIKGPLVGAAVVCAPIGAFMLWERRRRSFLRYVWLPGWAVFGALAIAWTWAARRHFPEIGRNLAFDYSETTQYDEPRLYYFYTVLWLIAPWSPLALWELARLAWRRIGESATRGTPRSARAFPQIRPEPSSEAVDCDALRSSHAVDRAPAAPRTGQEGEALIASVPARGALLPEGAAHRRRAERFVLCWAIVPLLVLSIPHRKHHHYMLPSLAPWAVLAALALPALARKMFSGPRWSRHPAFGGAAVGLPIALAIVLLHRKIPAPFAATAALAIFIGVCVVVFYLGLWRQRGRIVLGAFIAGTLFAYCWGSAYVNDKLERYDTIFLRQAEADVPPGAALFINADLHGEMDFFRIQFYMRPSARLLHNLTYLRADDITASNVYVITRASDQPRLEALGRVSIVAQSAHTRREKSAAARFTLFHLFFRPGLRRYPRPPYINTLQAMGREAGPWCGPH
jgi:4-amino-4-deoxy-L-arabinose transferase-like glycosyltransferase